MALRVALLRILGTALGLWAATQIVAGVRITGWTTFLLAALLLGVVNAVVRPVLVLLTLPLTVLTLGLFLFVVNGATLALVAWFLPGFTIAGLVPAVLAAAVVAATAWLAGRIVPLPPRRR